MLTATTMERIRELLRLRAVRFCDGRREMDDVQRLLREGARDVEALRAILPRGGEAAFFAALGLACAGDASALPVLREPNRYFMTNSNVELGLALCGQLVLGDVQPPLRFINASMLGELAELVGAFPPKP